VTITVEICVDSADGLAAALAGGADRIELCSALSLGGLTPTPGLMRLAAKAPVPVYAMIRPREGDFVWSPGDLDQMRRDIDAVRSAGLAGVVLGASEPRGRLDAEALFALVAHAGELGTTLHRAFDIAPDPFEALDIAASLGFERVLTSGGEGNAVSNLGRLSDLVQHGGARISLMPGAGVRPENATAILQVTGAREIHASCRLPTQSVEPGAVRMGFSAAANLLATSEETVAALVATVRTFDSHRG